MVCGLCFDAFSTLSFSPLFANFDIQKLPIFTFLRAKKTKVIPAIQNLFFNGMCGPDIFQATITPGVPPRLDLNDLLDGAPAGYPSTAPAAAVPSGGDLLDAWKWEIWVAFTPVC